MVVCETPNYRGRTRWTDNQYVHGLLPSRTNCSDNCSPKTPSEMGAEDTSVFTLSSFPSQRPIKIIISWDKLISITDAFSDVMESILPMQTSMSSSKLLGCEGMSKSLLWMVWQRFSKSTELTSVGLTWGQRWRI